MEESESHPAAGTATEVPTDDVSGSWTEVMRSLDELTSAVSHWAKAVKDDPENRNRARMLQERMEKVGHQIGDAVEGAAKSDFARGVGSAAIAAGDAAIGTARAVGDEIGPRLAGAVREIAQGIRRAADDVEQRATEAGPTPPPQTAPYTGEEPPAPAPSGTPDDYVP